MPQLRPTISRVLTVAMLMSSVLADTYILKSGERIEGKLLSETDTEMKIEIKISAGITDERVVAKADVAKVEKVSPDIDAYKAIAAIQPAAHSLGTAQYEAMIRPLQSFLTQYPLSTRAADVQKTLEELQTEKKRVEDGEMKLEGQWLAKEEVEKQKVQLHGKLAFNYMKSQATGGDFVGALNTFTALEKPYGGSASFPDAVDLAKQILARFKPVVDAALPNQKSIKADREKGFAAASPADRKDMMEAYKREQDSAIEAVAAAEKAGQWPPFVAGSEKSIVALQGRITRETTRLAALPVDKMRRSLQLAEDAGKKLEAGEVDAAVATLKEAASQWSANELAVRLTKDAAAAQKAAADAAKAATPTTTPKPTPKAATPKPKPSAAATPVSGAVAETTVEEESKPFYMTLPGAIGIVVGIAIVLGGVNVFQKMKKKKEAPVE